MNDSLESVRQPLDLVPRLLHVGLLVPHQLSEVEWHDGVQHRQHLVCSEDIDKFVTAELLSVKLPVCIAS